MASKKLGVVVVGMGIAGRVRVRDIKAAQELHNDFPVELKGYVSRRKLDVDGVLPLDLETALQRNDVHMVIIATENKTHEDIARKALEARKHVLVEFPLATSASAVKNLQHLAASNGLVCHEEVISLLSDEHQALKDVVSTKPTPLQDGSLTLLEQDNDKTNVEPVHSYDAFHTRHVRPGVKGIIGMHGFNICLVVVLLWCENTINVHLSKCNGWIENFEESGSPFTSCIFQLHTLRDLFGDLTAVSGHIKREEAGFTATGHLVTKDNGSIAIKTTRLASDEIGRKKSFCYKFSDDSVVDTVPACAPKPPGLFMRDFLQFVARITHGTNLVPSPSRTLQCHEQADALYQLAKDSADSSGL